MSSLPVLDNPFSQRVNHLIKSFQTDLRHSNYYPSLYVVKEEGDPLLRHWFMTHMLEDRQHPLSANSAHIQSQASSAMSYYEWIGFIKGNI